MWYKDFSNIMALASLLVGAVLLATGTEHADKGWLLITYTLGVGTKSVVGKPKEGQGPKPTNKTPLVFLLLSTLLLAGCVTQGLPQDVVSLANKVIDRHDTYVKNDPNLLTPEGSLDRETFLLSSQILWEFLNGSTKIDLTGEPDANTGILPDASGSDTGS